VIRFDHHAQFITITNLNWLRVLENDSHKEIMIEAMRRRVQNVEVTIYGFVIMPNHLHIIWQLHDGIIKKNFQRDFLKFTARSILNFMRMNDDTLLPELLVNDVDRMYQVWERNSLSIDLYTEEVFIQKMEYIHNNPIQPKWKLAMLPEEYHWSSASFYLTGITAFDFLTHFRS
jgi:putative transposase